MSAAPVPPERSRVGRDAACLVAAAWFLGFLVYFFDQTLPNNAQYTRRDVWKAVPDLLVDSVLPAHEPGAPPSGWRYLPQRFDLLLVAAAVLCGCWHLGALLLRAIGRIGGAPSSEDRAMGFANSGLLGLSAWSVATLGFGLAGMLRPGLFMGLLAGTTILEQTLRWRSQKRESSVRSVPIWKRRFFTGSLVGPLCVAIVAPFVLAMALGAMLPPTDFDVKAYHLTGPKQWHQEGRITFLENNVYASFPFLTEMLCLSTIVVRGDWFRGAMAGQLVLAAFAPLAATMIFSVARRSFGPRAGWMAATVYLTTPWVHRISIIAYVEGALAAYLIATLAAYLRVEPAGGDGTSPRNSAGGMLLCGVFAGCAAACKYPGAISAVIPFGVAALVTTRPLRSFAAYSAGVAATFGPWLVKNIVQTGNPVYPLLWKLFGGRGLDAELAARFDAGHPLPVEMIMSPSRWLPDLWAHVNDVAAMSDWQSGLMFGLAPASLLAWWGSRGDADDERAISTEDRPAGASAWRVIRVVWLYAGWLFATWWLLTHRIDRFWVPMLSVMAVLAGVGGDQLLRFGLTPGKPGLMWSRTIAVAIRTAVIAAGTACVIYNLGFVTSAISGNNAYLMEESTAVEVAQTQSMSLLNDAVPVNSLTLLVGDAETFDARRPILSHSVFNRSLFEELFGGPTGTDAARPLRPAAEIRDELKQRGITHVFVNWLEVLRYRTTYGYSDFVTPERFRELADSGVLVEKPLPPTKILRDVASLPADKRAVLESWGPDFVRRVNGEDWFPGYQLFVVSE